MVILGIYEWIVEVLQPLRVEELLFMHLVPLLFGQSSLEVNELRVDIELLYGGFLVMLIDGLQSIGWLLMCVWSHRWSV